MSTCSLTLNGPGLSENLHLVPGTLIDRLGNTLAIRCPSGRATIWMAMAEMCRGSERYVKNVLTTVMRTLDRTPRTRVRNVKLGRVGSSVVPTVSSTSSICEGVSSSDGDDVWQCFHTSGKLPDSPTWPFFSTLSGIEDNLGIAGAGCWMVNIQGCKRVEADGGKKKKKNLDLLWNLSNPAQASNAAIHLLWFLQSWNRNVQVMYLLQGLRPDTSKVRNAKHDDDDDDASSSLFLCNHHTESRSLWEAKPRVKRGRSTMMMLSSSTFFVYRHVHDAESNHYGISHGGQNNYDEDCLFKSATGFMTVTTYLYWQKFLCIIPPASPYPRWKCRMLIIPAGDGIIALLDPSQSTFTRTSHTNQDMMLDDFGTTT